MNHWRIYPVGLRACFTSLAILLHSVTMAPRAEAADITVGSKIATAQQVPLSAIDHDTWDKLLSKYVDHAGMVAYAAWKDSQADQRALNDYLDSLSFSNRKGTQSEKLAFWINAYNALTIKGILREYPTSSIRNHTARFFGYNIWKNLKLVVGGQAFSLDDIEHKLLRKLGEPRIHFAIVCASKGCPRLLNRAYRPEQIDLQLTENAKAFFSDSSKFRYSASRRLFSLSPILDWFDQDFGRTQDTQLKRISQWLPTDQAQRAAATGKGDITFLEYDWDLNDQRKR